MTLRILSTIGKMIPVRLIAIFFFISISFNLFATDFFSVTADALNIRKSPSRRALVVGSIHYGDIVYTNGQEIDGWLHINTQDSICGYVSSEYIKLIHSEKTSENSVIKQNPGPDIIKFYESLTVPKQSEGAITAIMIFLLLALIGIMLELPRYEVHLSVAILSLLCLLELYYILMENVDIVWFVDTFLMGWFGAIVCFILFGLFLFAQAKCMMEVLEFLSLEISASIQWWWGIIVWGASVILLVILSLFKVDINILILLFAAYQICFCIYIFIMCVKSRNTIYGILIPPIYLLFILPLTVLFAKFISILIIVTMVIIGAAIVLWLFSGSSGSNKRVSSDCVRLEDGTELRHYGGNEYRDNNGYSWYRDGNSFTKEDW